MLLKLTNAAQRSTDGLLPFIRQHISSERSQFVQNILGKTHSAVTTPPQKNPHNREVAVILALACGFFAGSHRSTAECQNETPSMKEGKDNNRFQP